MNIARSLRYYRRRYAANTIKFPADVRIAGAKWRLHRGGNLTERLMWVNRAYPEQRSVRTLEEIVRARHAQILDVGANCGVYSVTLARAAAQGSRLVSFEPNPQMRQRLSANLKINGIEAEIQGCALGPSAGTATLFLHGNMGEASLAEGRGEGGELNVPVRPLADFVQPGWDVTVLKIDVEGYEAEVLLPFFEQVPHEIWPTHVLIEVAHAESWSGNVVGKLLECGYRETFRAEGNALYSLEG